MLTIGFAGTAKNTGKTTAALEVLARCGARGLPAALTSIGYDGENLDNVTGLPKPRYLLQPGTLVATARRCLDAGSAGYRLLAETGIRTVLGPVQVVEITRPGSAVLAGPNRGRDLRALMETLRSLGAQFVIADGALNRLVPMTAADGLVLSTGAAFTDDILATAEHAGAACALFHLPQDPASSPQDAHRAQFIAADGRPVLLSHGSLLSREALGTLLEALPARVSRLVLPGACSPALVEALLAAAPAALEGCCFVFGSPFHLLASGDPRRWQQIFAVFAAQGQSAAVQTAVPLRLVTVNPFYPRPLVGGRYQPDYVDSARLLAAVRERVTGVPVVNVRQPAAEDILSLLGVPMEPDYA